MCDKNDSPNKCNYKFTPPTIKKVRNPFDKALIERLHNPLCSPGMCKIYKKRSSGSFRWDIDQVCTLVPTEIVACNSQFEPSPDPALEKIAEEATEIFFSQEMVMPSPMESLKKIKPLIISDSSLQISDTKPAVVTKDGIVDTFPIYVKHTITVSAQTVLTLPPELPPEVEQILQQFSTFTLEQNISGDYEITANGSLRRQLFFEEPISLEHYDSEHTDDETPPVTQQPTSSFETHSPVVFSPDLSRDLVASGMKRTFVTPLKKSSSGNGNPYRNKILDVVDFGEQSFSPIGFRTPNRGQESTTSSSLASTSISPVTKATSSDEEKNNFTSPESDLMATCLDCLASDPDSEEKRPCYCKRTPDKALKRSASLKESPPKSRKHSMSFSDKRSLSMSSLHRSRSVQKLDFSMDMSVDGSFTGAGLLEARSTVDISCKSSTPEVMWPIMDDTNLHNIIISELLEARSTVDISCKSSTPEVMWPIMDDTNLDCAAKFDDIKNRPQIAQSSTKNESISVSLLDDTPIKGKCKSTVLYHEISKIRTSAICSPMHMSLDSSLDNSDIPLSLEDKKIDFNNVDLNFLTDNVSQYDCANKAKVGDSSSSLRKVDSGYNENTFYANASSYYGSAIKPPELTITNMSKLNSSKVVLKEISNVPWMRVDSGFKDENSEDNTQFYLTNDSNLKKYTSFRFSEAPIEEKENVVSGGFDKFLGQAPTKNEAMSMSEIFTEDMTFNCNFSSTPSKNKARKNHS